MQSMFGFSSTIGAAALSTVLVASVSQPAWAAATQIVGVEVKDTSEGIELVLKQARPGDRPQVFSVERGSSWVADIINSQLVLPEGGNFQSLNPAPGIASIQVVALDANSVRLIVTGEGGAPSGQLSDRNPQGLSFSFVAGSGAAASGGRSAASAPVAQSPAPSNRAQPEVLVPNPEITITGGQPTAIPRQNPAPPFLPRAVAPPLGDIAVSELVPLTPEIDLGTVERVPRLVLRDAPAREVLALLARAAGLNLAFINSDAAGGATPEGQAAAGGEGPAVTLDIENEPVQDVFNYVLRLTGLEASRKGQTIMVGAKLPADSQEISIRTLRLNQAEVSTIAGLLGSQGAVSQQVTTVSTRNIQNVETGAGGEGSFTTVTDTTETVIKPLTITDPNDDIPLLLKGLSVVTDERLNQITLVGSPQLIELATSFIKNADLRVRQVAVNVKIVDINLLNTSVYNSSFSFGVGDNFIVSDGGTAAINFGPYAPPNSLGDVVSRPVITNPFADTPTVVDLSNVVTLPTLTTPGQSSSTSSVATTTQTGTGPGLSTIANNLVTNTFGLTGASLNGNQVAGSATLSTLNTDQIASQITQQLANLVPNLTTTQSQQFSQILSNQLRSIASQQGTFNQTFNQTSGLNSVTTETVTNAVTSALTAGGQELLSQIAAVSSSPLAAQLVDTAGNFALPTLFQYPSRFLGQLRAQVVSGNAKILTDPTLTVQEGSTATINLTQEVFAGFEQEAVTSESGAVTIVQNPLKVPVGLTLALIVDRIDDNGFVTLAINPTVSSISGTFTAPGSSTPAVLRSLRTLESGTVRLRDGQTLILAGVIQEQDRESVTKWPILGDIPIIGSLFRNTNSTKSRSEVVIVVTPQIMDDSDRSNFGYSYTPGTEAQQLIDRRR